MSFNKTRDRNISRKRFEKIQGKPLLENILNAFESQIEHSQALNSTKKAQIIFKNESAGHEYELKSQIFLKKRNSHLKSAKQWFMNYVETIDNDQKEKVKEFLIGTNYRETLDVLKQSTLVHILQSKVSHEKTQSLLEQVDKTFNELEQLQSFKSCIEYITTKFEDMILRGKGNPSSGLSCVILLILYYLGLFTISVILFCCIWGSSWICYRCVWYYHYKLYALCGLSKTVTE